MPIDADKLTEPQAWVRITQPGTDGWYHCEVQTTARTADEAKAHAALFLEQIFHGRQKLVRAEPYGEENRDFEHNVRVVKGGCRFHFHATKVGPTEVPEKVEGVQYLGFGAYAGVPS